MRVTVSDSGLCCCTCVFWALINSLVCWFCTLGLLLFEICVQLCFLVTGDICFGQSHRVICFSFVFWFWGFVLVFSLFLSLSVYRDVACFFSVFWFSGFVLVFLFCFMCTGMWPAFFCLLVSGVCFSFCFVFLSLSVFNLCCLSFLVCWFVSFCAPLCFVCIARSWHSVW